MSDRERKLRALAIGFVLAGTTGPAAIVLSPLADAWTIVAAVGVSYLLYAVVVTFGR